jgi:hypothetical protein
MRKLFWIGVVLVVSHSAYCQDVIFRQHLRQPDRYSRGELIESMWLQTKTNLVPLEWVRDSIHIDFNEKTGRITYNRWIECKAFMVPTDFCPLDSAELYCNLGKYWVAIQILDNHFDFGVLTIEMIEYRWPYRLTIFGGWRFGFIINGSYAKAKKIKGFNP